MGPPTGEQAKATPPEAVVATGPPHADPASQAERESCARGRERPRVPRWRQRAGEAPRGTGGEHAALSPVGPK